MLLYLMIWWSLSLKIFDEQNKISSILSSLDDKIELNLQMNKTLESIVLAIFKECLLISGSRIDGELVDGLPKGWRKGR
jgi:type I restriction enzyme S subunit